MPNTRKPATSFPTFNPNSYNVQENGFPSNGFPSVNSDAITNRVQQQALNSTWIPMDNKPIDVAGFSIDNSVLGGLGGSFNSPVSNSNDFSLSDYDFSKDFSLNWGQDSPQTGDRLSQAISGYRNTTNSNSSNSSGTQVNRYEGPSNKDKAEDAYVASQKAVADALVSNLGQSTAMGWAGFAVQAVQSVANIALSIEQYKLGKKQFKQAKREYAYNVDKREQSIHDTLSTRAEQGGLTGQAKEDWMASRGANANRY